MLDQSPALRDQGGWFGRHPIHVAAEAGNLRCVELLLKRGASPEAREQLYQQTPLHFAVASDAMDCVNCLLEAGAEVNSADTRHETPIFYCKSRQIIERLAAAGANLHVMNQSGRYPFQYCAAYIRSFEVMQFWMEQEVEINHVPPAGWPALNAVAAIIYGIQGSPTQESDLKILGLLLDRGADVSLCDRDGNPSLYHACVSWHHHLLLPLLRAGADPNQQNRAGDTPLHAAVYRGTVETVRLLLENGADVNIPNRHRKTPYDVSEDMPEIRAMLGRHHRPQVFPLPTAEEVLRRLKAIPRFRDVALQGCSDGEIDQLEQQQGVTLPKAYRQFLAALGKGAGEFMLSYQWGFRLDEVSAWARADFYHEYCDLPANYFVFAENCGCVWVFFIADGATDDPPVFQFTDGEDRKYKQVARTFWEFVESLVIDYEIRSDSQPQVDS